MKRDGRELLETFAGFLALIAITLFVSLVATKSLELLGIAPVIPVDPWIGNDGEEVTLPYTSPGYSAILFALSIAIFCLMLWNEPKPKGWIFASSIAGGALVIAWIGLAVVGLLLDTTFGFEDGIHQGIATAVWLVICCLWGYAVYRVLEKLHLFLTFDSVRPPIRKPDKTEDF